MKRFWKEVAVERADGGWRVTLDGRPIKTQGGAPQVVPTEALAELLAAEWRAQGEEVDPAAFPARDTADYAIDMVAADTPSVVAKILRYGETDTLCYRADPDEPLHKRQWTEWEPFGDGSAAAVASGMDILIRVELREEVNSVPPDHRPTEAPASD